MEISIKRDDLVRGLHLVQGVVERRSTLPILANVLIEPAEGGLAFTATDTEVGLRALVPGQVVKKGAMTLNARKLYEIARESAAEEVTIRSATPGWAEVLGGARYRVVSLDPKDFPAVPLGAEDGAGAAVRIAAGTLREMIDKTLFAVSSDETRYNLSGVFMESAPNDVLRMVATDGHRLALIERSLAEARLTAGVIVPRKGLGEVRKLLDDAEDAELRLIVREKNVRVLAQAVSLFMRLVEGEFPDYRQVIPTAPRVTARVNRDDLLAALRRTSLLASERSHGVRLHFERGRLAVSASNPEQGEASEEIEISYAGEPISIGFNARYLMDVLLAHAAGDVVEIGLTDEVGPGVIRGSQDPEYTYVVMPMRL